MTRLSILLAVLFLPGCAGFGQVERISDLSAQQLKQIRELQLYETDRGLAFTSHGRIKGLSCKGSAWSGGSREEAAMTQLKIKAVKAGATGILYPTCSHDVSVDWGNNCWESWVCVGEAITVQ